MHRAWHKRWSRPLTGLVVCVAGLPGALAQVEPIDRDSVVRLLERSFDQREEAPEQALAWAQRALAWADAHGDRTLVADAWRKVALAQHERVATLDSSFTSMQHAMGLSAAIEDSKGEQSAAKSLAKWYNERGEYTRALGYADRSLQVARAAGDKGGECSALVTKGNTLRRLGDLEGAAATYYTGLELARELADTTRLLDLLNNIGTCHYEIEQIEVAEGYFRQQQVLSLAAQRTGNLVQAYRNLAMCARERRQYARALQLVDSALALMQREGVPMEDRIVAMGNRGNYLISLGRNTEARVALDEAIAASREWKRPTDRAYMLCDLGDVEMREGHFARSDSVLQEALNEAGSNMRARMMALRLLSTLREREERWEEAKNILSAYIAARDSFINEQATDQLARAEMRQKYQAHEQDLEIEDLGGRIAQERRLRNLVLGISVMALVLAVLAIRNWRFQRELRLRSESLHEHEVSQLLKQQEIQALDAVMRGQEQERSRIAKDLHDRVGSLLSAVKLQFGALEDRIQRVQATANEQYQRVSGLLDTAVDEVRRISHDMEHGSLARFGLQAALEDLREAVEVPGKLQVELDTFGLSERLDKRLEIAAYRMVQESISNALKHAKAGQLTIQVTRTAAQVNIVVADDGKGFDTAKASDGMGLSNLRARAAEFGGTVRIDTWPGKGTTVLIDLPVPPRTP